MNQNFSSPFANPSGSTTSATGANSMNMNASIGNTSLSGISMNGMAGINMGNNQYQQQMFYQQQMNTTIPSQLSPLIGSNPMMNIVNSNRSLGLPSQIQNNNFVGGSVNVGLQNINQQGQMNQMGQMPLNMNNFQMGYNQVNPSFTQNFNPSMVSSPMINNQSMNMASNMNSIQSQQRLGGSNLNPIGNPQLQSQQTQNRPNIFRTLDGTMHQRLNERPSFDLVLNRYLEQRGISPSQIPTFIDCFVLFHTVLQHGGYEKVTSENKWGMIGQVIGHNAQGGQLAKFYFSVFSLLEQLVKGNGRPVQTGAQQPSPRPQPTSMQMQQQGFRPQGVQMALAGLPNSNTQFGQNQANLPPLPLQPQSSMPSLQLNTQLSQTQFTNSTDFLNQALDSMTSALDEKNEDLPAPDQMTQTVSSSGNAVEETLEAENLPNEVKSEEIIDDGTYVPKTRMVQSLGGIDFTTLAPVLKRPKPSRDHYASKNLDNIHKSLICRLDLEVRFALDTLVIYSSEEDLFLAQCPQLLNSLVEYFFEVMNKLYASCKAQRFYDYKTLYEMETLSNEVFQGSSEATIDEKGMLANKLAMLSMIFRNCSMMPDNIDLMGKHPGFAKVVILMLKVPVPIELEDFFENPETNIAQSLPCTTLEHRKNAVIVLSNIGGKFPIPNTPTLQLITSVCKDFISETDTAYIYPAVDCLAKIFVDAGNQAKIADLDGMPFLVAGLLLLIPTKAFPYEASKPLMALYELVMLLLCIITSNIRGRAREKVMTKQFAQHMLILSKRPAINYRATIPIEIIREFWSVRERALRIYLTCIKGKKLGDLAQTELILMMSIAQRDGDLWMSAAILEFMLDQE